MRDSVDNKVSEHNKSNTVSVPGDLLPGCDSLVQPNPASSWAKTSQEPYPRMGAQANIKILLIPYLKENKKDFYRNQKDVGL